jgi:acyl dehydratase
MTHIAVTQPGASLQPGDQLGPSEWIEVTQSMISQFGVITKDPDPMHIDPEWARSNGPYGGAIAFGFLTLSLLTHMLHEAVGTGPQAERREPGHFLNYGFNRVRFIAPVRAGDRVRGHFEVTEKVDDDQDRCLTTFACRIEIEGGERPALIADWLSIAVPPEKD